ncbi:hypothetical protein Golax_000636, partial [Gossypium laxum]|nr:hypothetical protein [Gossypium laxum]
MVVKLNNAELDTRKHSEVTFKEINDQNRESLGGGKGHTDDLGEQFKLVSNSKVPLADSINLIVEPISAQLNTKAGKVSGSSSGMLLDKSRNFK